MIEKVDVVVIVARALAFLLCILTRLGSIISSEQGLLVAIIKLIELLQ